MQTMVAEALGASPRALSRVSEHRALPPPSLRPDRAPQRRTSSSRGVGQITGSAVKTPAKAADASLKKKAAQAALDLKRNGWACVEGLLSKQECKDYIDGFWDWAEALGTGIDRHRKSTWGEEGRWPPSFRGIINSLEVAHQAFVWRVRKHEAVRQIYAELWGTDALLSSFDSINAVPPTAEPPAASWLHVDQAPMREGMICIQGLVNMVPVSPDTTGTLLVKHGSHHHHQKFFADVSKVPKEELAQITDHYQFTPEELPYWDDVESVGIKGGAGSMFLWDSRTVHGNIFPAKLDGWRHVVYACYQPASMATPADLERKRRAYREYVLTTHWPAMNVALHDNSVEYYGSMREGAITEPQFAMKRTRDAVEDDDLRKLAGVHAYERGEVREWTPLLELPDAELEGIINSV